MNALRERTDAGEGFQDSTRGGSAQKHLLGGGGAPVVGCRAALRHLFCYQLIVIFCEPLSASNPHSS